MHDIFMHDILIIVLRSSIVYLSIILFIRIFGKKEISQLSVIDLVFILLISNSVQNAMVGNDSSLQGGLIAAATLFAINGALRYYSYRNKKFANFLQGSPVLLVYNGTILEDHLKKEHISIEELKEAMREHGVNHLSEINLAVLETDGNISILTDNYTKKTARKRRPHKALMNNN